VGESGSGKSLTLRTILGLLPAGIEATGGRVLFEGVDLLRASKKTMKGLRGTGITMIFQEPMTSLNPIAKVGEQIVDAARVKHSWSRSDARTTRCASRATWASRIRRTCCRFIPTSCPVACASGS